MLTFAIAIPHLNQAGFLPTALESLRHQSVAYKVAFMDGGSTDNFRSVLEHYRDVVAFVDYGPDSGQAEAIKKGLELCNGEIVAWLNADDYYFPRSLDRIAEVFTQHPEVDVIYGEAVHVEPSGLFQSHFHGIEDFSLSKLFKSCYICQPSCFVRRRAYEEVGGIDTSLTYTMDWDLWCRLALKGKTFFRLREPIAAVRYYPGTKTLSRSNKRYMEIWRIQRLYGKYRIPTAWPGFYWFDLANNGRKNTLQRIFFYLLQGARLIKKKAFRESAGISYGFHKWENKVVGTGTVLFPWYGDELVTSISIKVRPGEGAYMASVGGRAIECYEASRGEIKVPLSLVRGSVLELRLSCASRSSWEMLGLSWIAEP